MNNFLPGLETCFKSLASQISELHEERRKTRIAVERAARKARLWAAARPAIMAIVVSILTILAVHYWR